MSHLMSNLNIKIFIIGFIFLIGFNSTASSNSIEDIITKINTIENRIKVLEKATFNKINSSQSNFNAGNYDSIITKQSIQISELQNQIQELTGSIEEVLFSLQTLINNFNNFKADTEMRFSDVNIVSSVNNNQAETTAVNEVIDYDLAPKNLGTLKMPTDDDNDFSIEVDPELLVDLQRFL